MYINDLGIGRSNAVYGRENGAKAAKVVYGKNADGYAAVMKKAVDNQKSTVTPTFATAGDIIIKEAFEKMKTDPEWEESVMNKVKAYYGGDSAAGRLSWTGQNSLQNYLLQGLIGGQNGLGIGLTGYSPYSFGNLAASAYGSLMSGTLGGSVFGNWQL